MGRTALNPGVKIIKTEWRATAGALHTPHMRPSGAVSRGRDSDPQQRWWQNFCTSGLFQRVFYKLLQLRVAVSALVAHVIKPFTQMVDVCLQVILPDIPVFYVVNPLVERYRPCSSSGRRSGTPRSSPHQRPQPSSQQGRGTISSLRSFAGLSEQLGAAFPTRDEQTLMV